MSLDDRLTSCRSKSGSSAVPPLRSTRTYTFMKNYRQIKIKFFKVFSWIPDFSGLFRIFLFLFFFQNKSETFYNDYGKLKSSKTKKAEVEAMSNMVF